MLKCNLRDFCVCFYKFSCGTRFLCGHFKTVHVMDNCYDVNSEYLVKMAETG